MKTRKWIPYCYILPAFLLVILFVYYPIVQNFSYSLYELSSYSVDKVFVGFKNYTRLFHDPIFYTGMKNNIFYALLSLLVQVGGGLLLAMLLESRYVGRSRAFFRSVYFIPSVISITAVGLLWRFVYEPRVGLINTFLTIIGCEHLAYPWLGASNTAIFSIIAMSQWQYTGYIAMLFIVAIQKIPNELYEAAEIDGANGIFKSLHITLPLVKEMVLVTSTITIIGAFKVFTEVYTMTRGGPGSSSHVLSTYLYQSAFLYDEMGYASAIGGVIFLITLSLSVLQLKIAKSGRE